MEEGGQGTNKGAHGILRVKLVQAADLIAADSNGKSDPYVVLTLNGTSVRSKTVPKTLSPVWQELFSLRVQHLNKDVLHLRVMDWDAVSKDDPLGEATVSLADLVQEEEKEMWVPLTKVASGRVQLTLMAINCGQAREGGTLAEVSGDASPKTKKERKEMKKEKRKKEKQARTHNILDVVVLEGLDLTCPGKSATTSSPYCVVRLGGSVYVTSIKRNAHNCIWQEDCSFELTEDDKEVHITVINEAASQSEKLLGELRIPLADIRKKDQGEARLYQLTTADVSIPTGYLRLQLQLNSASSGILARHGSPLCATIPMRVNIGDIVLFSCSHIGAMVTKVSTASTWDHVAMIVQREDGSLSVFESCPGGVRVIRYLDSYFTSYFDAGATVAVRRLTAELDDTARSALSAFVQQMDGKPYEKNLLEMVRGSLSLNTNEDLSGVFCSELIAAAYQRMGLLGTTNTSNNYMPAHFAKAGLPLQRGASLGPFIRFKPKRIKPALMDASKLATA